MTYTIAVVDEGLLGLTRYSAQNPWNEFYKKEASRLSSWDIYRYVMSAYGGKLETLLSIGGSEDILNGNTKKAERFKPVVLFFGPFELKANEKAETTFKMPQYVGAVRVMVVAGKNAAYGTAEKSVPVRSDLMVLPTLPRSLGVNETIEVPVTVFNGKEKAQEVLVGLKAEGVVQAGTSQVTQVPATSDKTVVFKITCPTAGIAKIHVTAAPASGPGKAAESSTEIDVISRGSPLTTARRFTLTPGSTYKDLVPSPGEKGSKSMSIELATLPVLDLQNRLRYLISYPHGCIEQITSGAFPQLFVSQMIQTTAEETERIKKNVLSVIERYPKYQTVAGGFAYWPGNTEENEWGTCYAGHFMIEAKKAGYDVPDSLYEPWISFQQSGARNWQSRKGDDGRVQAYRLYTLALAGKPDIGAMNRLSMQRSLPTGASWLLAGAYALSGHRDTAQEMTSGLETQPAAYRENGYTFGSNYRDAAIALNTLNIMNDVRRVAEIVPDLADAFGSERWFSTQETAWMLISLSPHYRNFEKVPVTYSIEWDKGTVDGLIDKATVIRELEPTESATQTISVKNTGGKNIYGKVTTRGIIPAGSETRLENGLALTVQYIDSSGRVLQPEELVPGDSFTVQAGVTNLTRKKVENIALELPVPTCWEFTNERVGMDAVAGSTDSRSNDNEDDYYDDDYYGRNRKSIEPLYDYRDIRDTHIYTYFGLNSEETKTFTFSATVAYNGNYYVPAIHAEAMYDTDDYQAVLPGLFVRRVAEQSGR